MNDLYKIVIVDDEATISEGLSSLVKWNENGFQVVGTFFDGKEAMDFLEENDVHVVLTDIKMPCVSGVELAKWIYENRPEIKVVFLTGFKEFDYARQALKYNVNFYLLKPTDLSELYETFGEIKNILDTEHKQTEYIDNVKQIVQTQFLSNVFFGVLRDHEKIKSMAVMSGLEQNITNYQYVVLQLEILQYEEYINTKSKYSTDQLYDIIYNWFALNYLGTSFVPVYTSKQYITYIAYALEGMENKFEDEEFIKTEISGIFNFNLNVEISRVYKNIYELADDCASNNISLRKTDAGGTDLARLFEKQKILATNIFFGDMESTVSVFESIMREIDSFEFEEKRNYIEYVFSNICKKIQAFDMNVSFEPNLGAGNDNELYSWGKSIIVEMINNVRGGFEHSKNFVINKAKTYIKDNYSKDITLSDVANHVFLSSAYFSRLFKKQCNENFSDYLMRIRISNATFLLENTSLKVYEIAEKVGFKTLKYFYKNFKEYTGLSPSEYRGVKNTSGEDLYE